MSILISAHQLSKSFAARPLFTGLTFGIESGDRIGMIGPNGAGKSTLLRILSSQIPPDSGTLSCQRGLKVGFLEQVPDFSDRATILSTITEGHPELEGHGLVQEYISKFGFDVLGPETPIEKLSGGWKKRAALARELVKKPDLLLLDEPTNHLDVESILWLETWLARASCATLTITHDRLFLQRISNRIMELDPRHQGGLLTVKGDYATYLEIREQMILAQEKREIVLKNTLRRETEWLRQGAKARTTKQQARIQRADELQQEVSELSVRNQSRTARIDFQSSERNPKKLIEAKGITKSYGGRLVIPTLDLMITPKSRIGLLGANGSGKSTLIRVLIGQEEVSTGTIMRSEHLSIAYFDQTREALDPDISVAETLCPSGDHVDYRGSRVHIRGYLDRFLFTQKQMDMSVGKLSGGEQSRLLIARLMLTQANLLVLDEPTNDLDMATLNVLEECLTDFSGAVILVTHDRYFLDQVANQILAFPPGNESGAKSPLITFSDLSQWEAWYTIQSRQEKKTAGIASSAPSGVSENLRKKRKLSYKEQRELDSLEPGIHAAEVQLKQLIHECSLPENSSNSSTLAKLTQKMAETQTEITRLYHRWAELEEE